MLKEEAEQFAAGIRTARICEGSIKAPTRPGMAASMQNPLFNHRSTADISLDRASEFRASCGLTVQHRCSMICSCTGLGDYLISIDTTHCRVVIAMENNGWNERFVVRL